MPIILAIETSSELASAALLQGDTLLVRESSGVQTHSQTLLPMVQSVLAQADLRLSQCAAIAFGAGPGAFTGVRTACGIAQGLAFGANLPVVSIVTLLAMAEACRAETGKHEVLAVLDARMGEVYWAQYSYVDGWRTVIEPTLSAVADVLPQCKDGLVACGNGFSAYPGEFALQTQIYPWMQQAYAEVMPYAASVARLARTAFAAGHILTAEQAQPIYLRNKIALTTEERLALKAGAAR
ncbi:tRNA (adenosine(37)-N6)-threonylcarbamoyltransferase complex dimerization subunit type 1 TsaB [Herminiimonas sp. CN]|uniref:tRNA (adenosine(37)-N6)-threonylcarbamoyltransferase complex dimerization subunit type 1 TsaB n=1 Tax=Herminiimonas sp. CN TaxID=1349818 RepID=UPI000473D8BA|nr:tRNA (adenosine(37)-N6)-threonylcarbamoyltransferase complex dimerization subunit type 1 TsaB [Herminiimonas sp. CN]